MYLLDSNAWIALFRKKSAKLLSKLKQYPATEIATCPIVLAELWYGACKCDPAFRAKNQKLVNEVRAKHASIPMSDAAGINAAELRSDLEAKGQTIGPHDILIAAIARINNVTLVTHNIAEFSRVPALNVEDWE